MALSAQQPRWWQWATSAFVNANLVQLSFNTFLVYLWGHSLRKELSSAGVWFAYCLCGVGKGGLIISVYAFHY